MASTLAKCVLSNLKTKPYAQQLIGSYKAKTYSVTQTRQLLSPAFYCDAEWRARLSEPMLAKVNTDILISQLFIQFERNGAATAVDMEVFSNKIPEVHPTQLHLVELLLTRFRKSIQGGSVIDSMSHCIIRGYMELNQAHRLIPMLQQKMDYGVFPDDIGFCLLLDHFIKAGDLESATKIAAEMMLQDDMSHRTARLLALHACATYIDESKDKLLSAFTEDDKPVLDAEEEEEYVVVKFLPLHNFDDHFDVMAEKRLIGKTLDIISKQETGPVFQSYQLIAQAMHEDFNKLFSLLENFLENSDGGTPFHKEVLDMISLCVEACKFKTETIVREAGTELAEDAEYNARHTVEDKQSIVIRYQELRPRLEACPLVDTSLLADTKTLITEGLESGLESDIQSYKSQMQAWTEQRTFNIDLQDRAFQQKSKQGTLNEKIKELTEKEALLNYFVRQNEISLALLRAGKAEENEGEVDLTEYVAEPGKRGKRGKLGM